MRLRMAFLAAPILARAERFPLLVGHGIGKRQAGKNDLALRHARDSCEQRGDGRGGGGDSGGDGEAFRRAGLPAARRRSDAPHRAR